MFFLETMFPLLTTGPAIVQGQRVNPAAGPRPLSRAGVPSARGGAVPVITVEALIQQFAATAPAPIGETVREQARR